MCISLTYDWLSSMTVMRLHTGRFTLYKDKRRRKRIIKYGQSISIGYKTTLGTIYRRNTNNTIFFFKTQKTKSMCRVDPLKAFIVNTYHICTKMDVSLDIYIYIYVLQVVVCPYVLFILDIVVSVRLRYSTSN